MAEVLTRCYSSTDPVAYKPVDTCGSHFPVLISNLNLKTLSVTLYGGCKLSCRLLEGLLVQYIEFAFTLQHNTLQHNIHLFAV